MNINITYNFRILLSFWIIILVGNVLSAQQRSNPFEIRQRVGVVHEDKNIDYSSTQDILQEVLSDTVDLMAPEVGIGKSEVLTNPFDVDHVPIRKSAITERAERMHIQSENTQYSNSFLIWILLFSCVIIAILINLKSRLIGFVYRSIFNENILKLFQREEQRGVNIYLLLLYLNFLINISVLAYLIYTDNGGQKDIATWFAIWGVITIAYVFKHLGVFLIGKLFLIEKSMKLYNFTIMIFNHAMGIVLIPLNFLIAFAPKEIGQISLWIAIGIIAILLLLRTLRGLFVAYEYIFDRIFQIIVYLCAFEIAPVVIFIKIILNFHGS
ncbi:MAG: DUF4271 domain-containing protein [Chitinophagales bacterium]|nr:DUF4271 domain-containing protein [Chitinophagales bacterium]